MTIRPQFASPASASALTGGSAGRGVPWAMGSVGAVEQTIWPVAGSNQNEEFGSAPSGGPGGGRRALGCPGRAGGGGGGDVELDGARPNQAEAELHRDRVVHG